MRNSTREAISEAVFLVVVLSIAVAAGIGPIAVLCLLGPAWGILASAVGFWGWVGFRRWTGRLFLVSQLTFLILGWTVINFVACLLMLVPEVYSRL